MKKTLTFILSIAIVLSSCSSPESGAINGASFGSIFGSALGGIIGGPRGHDVGTMVGLVVGGAGGAAVGAQQRAQRRERALNRAEEERQQYEQAATVPQQRQSSLRKRNRRQQASERYEQAPIDIAGESVANSASPLQLRNLRFIGENGNQTIDPNETCQVVFELANASGRTVTNVVPYIHELSGNEHLNISPSTRIEAIPNGDAIRYTATIRADNKLREGKAVFRISVSTEEGEFVTLRDFSIGLAK